jgi:hypothetical protein
MNPTMNTSAAITPVSRGLSSKVLGRALVVQPFQDDDPERDRQGLKEKARVAAEEFGHLKRVVGPAPYGKDLLLGPCGSTPPSGPPFAGRRPVRGRAPAQAMTIDTERLRASHLAWRSG